MFAAAGACFDTAAGAVAHVAALRQGEVHASGGSLYALTASGATATGYTLGFQALDGGPSLSSLTVSVVPEPCELLGAADAAEATWLVALALCGVFGLKFVARALKG